MLKVKNISFSYTQEKKILQGIDFNASKGQYIAIVGESGCGKSTLLELIYGLLDLDNGSIYWNDTKLLGPKFHLIPGEEFMKYLPQDFDLMPFTTVEENVGKHVSRLDTNRKKRIFELLEIVDMTEFINTKVKNLSGGQKQRVAIAKVLAKEPEVLLLDEPFSHIDNFRKNTLRRNLFNYLNSKSILCIVATHDITDALSFADEILVIQNGKIERKDKPEKIYSDPQSAYIASFFNEINEIPEIIFNPDAATNKKALFYPEEIKVSTNSGIEATITQSYFKGAYYLIEGELKDQTKLFFKHHEILEKGKKVNLSFLKKGLK